MSVIKINSFKHDGSFHRSWENSVILSQTESELIGANENALVTEKNGHQWRTTEPAVFYFPRHDLFNVIGLIKYDGTHYYCNISSPFMLENETLSYIDYDLDIIVTPSFSYELVDQTEYLYHQQK